jgi:hypothetical protein
VRTEANKVVLTCWSCGKMSKGGVYFPGRCMLKCYGADGKEIPSHIVDKGCKYWSNKETVIQEELFNGTGKEKGGYCGR